MEVATFTGIGARRRQEDAYVALELGADRVMVAVADGMGGHDHGDEASKTVVTAIADYWGRHATQTDTENKIAEAIAQAGSVYESIANGREMGSTLVMAAIDGSKAIIAHCGDSRIYIWRKATNQMFHTNDHSIISPEGWPLVTNAFFTGMCRYIHPETRQLDMQPGDRLMLCSDGVSNYVPPEQLWEIFKSERPLKEVAEDIETYCMAMSSDNYTAIIIQF